MLTAIGRTRLVPLLLTLTLAARAHADAHPISVDPTDQKHELVIDLKIELPIVFAAGAILGVAQGLNNKFGPQKCGWCDTRTSLNGFDKAGLDAFAGANRHASGIASDIMGYAGMPVLTLGLGLIASLDADRGASRKYRARRFGIDVLLMTEAVSTTLTVMDFTKYLSKRRRPSAIDEPVDGKRIVDQNLSFFSGHTALAFSLASSAGMIATLRHERLAPLVWVVGMAAATATGITRLAANQHFASDVVVGGAVGAGIGALVPLLHRFRSPVRVGGSAGSTYGMLSVSGQM